MIPGIQCPGKKDNCDDGIDYATWGQYVFWSTMKHFNAEQGNAKRTIMLGCSGPSHRALHRTPVHWTGDNHYDELALGIQQTVDGGVDLQPWIHQDCGSHHGPGSTRDALHFPVETYVRWFQYCSASNVARLHSDPALSRLPWSFGDEAEGIAKQFFAMRQSLRPTLNAAARLTHDEGVPVVRRCDLEWPELAAEGASDSQQYLLADDLLVRPVDPFVGIPIVNATTRTYAPPDGKWNRDTNVWLPPGEWHDAFTGETHRGGKNLTMRNVPLNQMPMFHRGGGMVITAAATELRLHVWPTQASCGEGEGSITRPTVQRKLYAPSDVDPAGVMAPWTATKRELADGAGFELDIQAGDFAFDDEAQAEAAAEWTLYVHLPDGADADATALYCGSDRGSAVETRVLATENRSDANLVAPFSSSRVVVPPRANSVVEAKIDLSQIALMGAKGGDARLQCRFGCRAGAEEVTVTVI